MEWKIKKNRFDATYLKINIEFEPKNDVLRYTLAQVKISNFPEFIFFQATSKTYSEEHVYIMNYLEMDWEDKLWAKNVKGEEMKKEEMFLVHDVMGETIIEELLFDKLLLDYGTILKEVYHNDNTLSDSWNDEMGKALEKLRLKIEIKG